MNLIELAAGLDSETDIPDDLARPLEMAMVIKGLDRDGKVAYWTISTPALMDVEIIGMMRWGESVALYLDQQE